MANTRPERLSQSPSLSATKNMLDELDALMERMLALPVNDLEDVPLPGTASEPRSLLAADLTMVEAPPLRKDPPAPPSPSHMNPPPGIKEETSGEIISARVAVPAFTDIKDPEYLETPSSPREIIKSPPAPPSASELETRRLVRPPVAVPKRQAMPRRRWPWVWWGWQSLRVTNLVFDRWTQPLGRTGDWLRSVPGRRFLGWAGLGLLASAFLWLLVDRIKGAL